MLNSIYLRIIDYCALLLRNIHTIFFFSIIGCNNNNELYKNRIFAIPLQPSLQQEVILARIEQILASRSLTNDEYGQLLYERGVLYDSLGLRALARNDFSTSLAIRPNSPEVFNFLGIYFTQTGNYENAYEAFDSVLELDPNYNLALMNRGIALCYGKRYKLAQDDLLAYYQINQNDPFRVLWLYIIEKNINAKMAQNNLVTRYNNAEKKLWGWNIVEFYLGYINYNTLMKRLKKISTDNTSLAEHLSETNFYLGKHYLHIGDKDNATALFKLSVANNVHSFIEHRYALLELSLLTHGHDNLESNQKQ
ncbi:Lipoprotein NlpI [Candidatus Providencia siddallii]|uniref:Lipoprotein NlpI n=1 Tax=Candidatus Providencia siddallii TaxID=1715285 RepID=A0A0M6W775_9GAMM|nr:Lipoprotein NlpI [Candidatus Providencia siddallii]